VVDIVAAVPAAGAVRRRSVVAVPTVCVVYCFEREVEGMR
jgi:hypothetical protein